jgi:hypothetical protein
MAWTVRRAHVLYTAILLTALAGCATSARPHSHGTEHVIPTLTRTYYFQGVPQPICYSFHVPGQWAMGRAPGLLRRADGRALAGVLLWRTSELGGGSVEDAIREAADRSAQSYELSVGPFPWTLVPFAPVPGAWAWHPREFSRDDRIVRLAPKWFVPAGAEWIAVVTIGTPPGADRDAFAEGVIRSLSTTREPRCYEERMRQLGVQLPR